MDISGSEHEHPGYSETFERPLSVNTTAAMYATVPKGAMRSPDSNQISPKSSDNTNEGLDRNKNVNSSSLSPNTTDNGNKKLEKEYQELPPPPLPTRRYKNGHNKVINGMVINKNLLGINEEEKKILMKNYDDVPLRKPLPAPGPVPEEMVISENKMEAADQSKTSPEEKTTSEKPVLVAEKEKCQAVVPQPPTSPAEKSILISDKNGRKSPPGEKPKVTFGSKPTIIEDKPSVSNEPKLATISKSPSGDVKLDSTVKPQVKGVKVSIPTVPELKKIEPEIVKIQLGKENESNSLPKSSVEPVKQEINTTFQEPDESKHEQEVKKVDTKKIDDLILRRKLLQEIKSLDKQFEMKKVESEKQFAQKKKESAAAMAPQTKKKPDDKKKKPETVAKRDSQDYPYEDVDVQTSLDGNKSMVTKVTKVSSQPNSGAKTLKPQSSHMSGGTSGTTSPASGGPGRNDGGSMRPHSTTFPRKVCQPGDLMSQSMIESSDRQDHIDITTNEPIHMTLEEVKYIHIFPFCFIFYSGLQECQNLAKYI